MPGAVLRHSLRARFLRTAPRTPGGTLVRRAGEGHVVPIVGCDANAKRLLFFDPGLLRLARMMEISRWVTNCSSHVF
jgi:hypothetical protein